MTVLPPGPPPAVPLPHQPADTPWPTVAWPTAELHGGARARVDTLLDEVFGPSGGEQNEDRFGLTLAVVAVLGGRLVCERYGETAGPDEQLISWSMAKSITQALVGVAVGEGLLHLDRPAPVPAWAGADDGREDITLDQLLRMTSGLVFNEDYVDADTSHCIEMLFGTGQGDMAGYAAGLGLAAAPDSVFNYSSGTTNIVCRILADAIGSGADFETWCRRALFEPIGMEARLTFDEAGTWVGSSFLHATARDFARFGLLYLRDGVWDGRRLLPAGWVDRARTLRAMDPDGDGYGSHWWIRDDTAFQAAGYETQRIIVDPAADLVLVRLGKTPTERADEVDAWLDRLRHAVTGS